MWECRKIYANLLLLSVLLFALGASAMPRIDWGFAGQCIWDTPQENMYFRWECTAGQVIYCGQQITAVVGGGFEFVLPEKCSDILKAENFEPFVLPGVVFCSAGIMYLPDGRAPPAEQVV